MPPKRNRQIAEEKEYASDFAETDATQVAVALDAIPGAWERTQEGLAQAARGEGVSLEESAS